MKEAGIALVVCSVFLSLFLFIPRAQTQPVVSAPTQSVGPDAYQNINIKAKAAVVYDIKTGNTLFDKNATAQLPLASLTKLLTVYTALNALGPDAIVTVGSDAEKVTAPHALRTNESFKLSELARITLTGSLNDGAVALTDAASKQAGVDTASLLASSAASLNLSQTYAINGSGLDATSAISGGYGSAHDIAILAATLVHDAPDIAFATTQPTATAALVDGKSITVKNTDPDVVHFPRLLLSKTGFTDLAGGNLVLVFDAGVAHPIAIVVLGSTSDTRFTDAQTLVAATIAHFSGLASL